MSGDTKETAPSTLATPSDPALNDPFPGIQATLDGILDELRGVSRRGPGRFDLGVDANTLISGSDWLRIRAAFLVVSCSAAGTAVLTIGSFARTFNIVAGVTPIPFPETIERGADVTLTGTAVGLTGYLIATPEG